MTPRRLKDILWVLALFGAVAVGWRLVSGLGATTDLSNQVPWGIWKVVNMIAGVALATGGFVLAFTVHVCGIKSWKPIVRPAILVALLGYGSSCFALLMDIGRPDRFWHPFFFWNPDSFLFEVFWCVTLYFTVTILEFSPIALEGSKFQKPYLFLKKISLPVVILGITFSTLHHTSLGSLFLVSPTRLHPIWYTPILPLLFIVSAVGSGMMSVVLVTLGIAHLYRRRAPSELLRKVAVSAAVVLSLFFVLKLVDLAVRGEFGAALSGSMESRLFIAETLLLAVLPILLIATPRTRRSNAGLALAALFAVAGLVLDRLDVGVFGYLRTAGAPYVPTLSELALTIGIPAAAGLVFLALVEKFRVFEALGPLEDPAACPHATAFEPQTTVWRGAFLDGAARTSLLVLIVVPIAVALFQATATARAPQKILVQPPEAADAARAVLRIDGDRNGDFVRFPHDEHKKRLGGEKSCARCHHLDLPNDHFPGCWRCHSQMNTSASIFDHERHQRAIAREKGFKGDLAVNRTCSICHPTGEPRGRETAKACSDCHAKNMRMPVTGPRIKDRALPYKTAFHELCVGCHRKQAAKVHRPDLPECATCHPARSQR